MDILGRREALGLILTDEVSKTGYLLVLTCYFRLRPNLGLRESAENVSGLFSSQEGFVLDLLPYLPHLFLFSAPVSIDELCELRITPEEHGGCCHGTSKPKKQSVMPPRRVELRVDDAELFIDRGGREKDGNQAVVPEQPIHGKSAEQWAGEPLTEIALNARNDLVKHVDERASALVGEARDRHSMPGA